MSVGTCPKCGGSFESSKVIDSRPTSDGSKRRRRECGCGERYTTYESIEPKVTPPPPAQTPEQMIGEMRDMHAALRELVANLFPKTAAVHTATPARDVAATPSAPARVRIIPWGQAVATLRNAVRGRTGDISRVDLERMSGLHGNALGGAIQQMKREGELEPVTYGVWRWRAKAVAVA